MPRTSYLLGALASVAFAVAPAPALNIVLNPDSSFTTQPNGAAALFAFQKAANFWNTVLTNSATLNFDVSYRALGANIIGSTGSNGAYASVRSVYDGLAGSARTALDATAVANLHPLTAAGGIGYRMPDSVTGVAGTGTGLGLETVSRGSVYDNDDTANNLFLYANTSNLKVLGVGFDAADTGFGTTSDASITFSSAFRFDFDPSDGISTGTQDFVSVAVHEMGHALGFVSGADDYDYFANKGPGVATGLGIDWDDEPVLSVLDLYRYSTNPPASSGFDPVTGLRYLQLDPNRGAGFSVDGENFFNGLSGNFANFATGAYNGDLNQASHWKDSNGYSDRNGCYISNTQIGIMDPTSGSCQPGIVTAADLAAFDAIGYNLGFDITQNTSYRFDTRQIFALSGLASLLPEPAAWMQMIFGFGLIGGALRTRRRIAFA